MTPVIRATVSSAKGAHRAAEHGADGLGLVRTELVWINRSEEPSVEEQTDAYAKILSPFPGRTCVVRTIDPGADKPLRFLDQSPEPNPALGLRGVRATGRRPDVLFRQLSAISAARRDTSADVWVMAPMVTSADEVRSFVGMCDHAGLPVRGVMLEVPAAAMSAGAILAGCDFASLGTNDLTQYSCAADRTSDRTASYADFWHPGVLATCAAAITGATALGLPIGVCGEAGSTPAAAAVLLGMGVTSLSVPPHLVNPLRVALSTVDEDAARHAATVALTAPDAESALRQAGDILRL